jgi:hypothetical protein
MDIEEYASQTQLTAKYPGSGLKDGLTYVALGMIGETGEVAEHIKKMMRDDDFFLTEDRREKLVKELGDVMWYWSEGRRCLGVAPPTRAPVVPAGRLGLAKIVFRMAESASVFASTRADGTRRGHLSLILECVVMSCDRLGVTIEHVMEQNALKLQRRLAENKISGSGSDR